MNEYCGLGQFLTLMKLIYCKNRCREKASLLPRKHYFQAAELGPDLLCVMIGIMFS